MIHPSSITRRRAVFSGLALATLAFRPALAQQAAIHVVKGTGCECCNAWVAYLQGEGFAVTEEERYGTLLMTYKIEVGVPQRMISCHTGMAEGTCSRAMFPPQTSAACLPNGRTQSDWPCPACPTDRPAWARYRSERRMSST